MLLACNALGCVLSPVAWILMSSVLFATLAALVKTASTEFSVAAILLSRSLPSAVALWAFAIIRRQRIRTDHWRLHLERCLSGVCGMALGIYAVKYLPLATAATLEYTAPLFLVAGYALLARSIPRWREVSTVLLGFFGVLLLLRPTMQADLPVPFFAGLVGGALGAVTYRSLRRLGEAGEPGWRIVLYYSAAGSLGGLASIPLFPLPSCSVRSLLSALGIGTVGLLAQLTMTRAFRVGPTSSLAVIQYSTVVFSAGYGVIFWGELPTPASLAGLTLILVSGAIAAREIARNERVRRVSGP